MWRMEIMTDQEKKWVVYIITTSFFASHAIIEMRRLASRVLLRLVSIMPLAAEFYKVVLQY